MMRDPTREQRVQRIIQPGRVANTPRNRSKQNGRRYVMVQLIRSTTRC